MSEIKDSVIDIKLKTKSGYSTKLKSKISQKQWIEIEKIINSKY